MMGARAAEPGAAQTFPFDLPAAPLEQALSQFSAQAGVSIGAAGPLPSLTTRAVRGRLLPIEALTRMLAGSGIEAVQLAPQSFRLQSTSRTGASPARQSMPLPELPEVLVTASKRTRSLDDLPQSMTVVAGTRLDAAPALPGSRALQSFDSTLVGTNLGAGRNRQFIRGVADSPFLGPSQATVSTYFDEARLNYSAPDPDLRLLDVERVEILKGPQGPLYGTGALGGVVHVVPRRPDLASSSLQVAASMGAVSRGGLATGGAAVLNLPLVEGALGLRILAYGADESGWIDNVGARHDANDTQLLGARLGLRGRAAGNWMFDVQGLVQLAGVGDSQYVVGTARSLSRSGILPEPRDNDLYMASATLHGNPWGAELVASSNYVSHEVDGTQDASAVATLFGVAAPARYRDDRRYRLLTNEVRLAGGTHLTWLFGVAHLAAHERNQGTLQPAPGQGALVLDLARDTSELALFGETGLPLRAGWRLTTGLRLSRVSDEDERRERQSPERAAAVMHGATPSVALDWGSADRRRMAYLRFARALRPGGLNPDAGQSSPRFRADELSTLDLGWRTRLAGGALSLQQALFMTRWRHVQADYLLANGLVGTRNVGDAANLGVESELQLQLGRGYVLEVGGVLQRARLDHATVTVARDDARLPVVPDARLNLALSRSLPLGRGRLQWQLHAAYHGDSRLSFEQDLDRRMPGFATVGAALQFTMARWTWQVDAENLLDARADTFAFGNPFSVRSVAQRTPLQPRTVALQVRRSW